MKTKNACLISCSDHYNHRLNVAAGYLESRGYAVTYITSDFDHFTKKAFRVQIPNSVQLHTRPYRKNLSLDRILSHRQFARDVFRYLENLAQQPDVLVVLLPPNFLAKYAAAYKKRHPNVRLVFDIFDLWPETFPSGSAKKLLAPVFRVWSWLRDHNLGAADHVITECEMFRQRLGLSSDAATAVYLGAEAPSCGILPAQLSDRQWDLCYLGSINNIIDIPKISALLQALATERPVNLHIIGSGERLQELMISAENAGAVAIYHGAVYDDLQKQKIMSECHFGLNIVKESVCIGLTMNSVDYFRNGLPIINNIPADTARIIEAYGSGIELDEHTAENLRGMEIQQCIQMRENTWALFKTSFERGVIDRQYGEVLARIL